ncbi:MAG: transglutaminaseTgpA domain-containing protein [Actinomycetota bacterium]
MPETLEAARAPELRLAIIAGFPTIAAGIMTGGLFIGVGGRVWACLCGLAGVALAWRASRIRQPALLYTAMILGIFGIGLVAVLPTGFSNILNVAAEIRRAVSTSDVLRPPVEFLPGWHAIQGWVMATVGFAAGWLGLEIRRPALGVVATLPVVGLGAISLPESQQIGSGLAALVLFVVGLGLLSGATPGDEEERRAARAYEIRRALRALPLLGAITVALYFAAQSEFLFPDPIYDPAQEAKLPKSVPLSEVEDRILFTVDATFTGPWKTGSLDVYDGESWRLPPFAASELKEVPESGIVDESLRPGVRATFTVRGLGGAILPGLPRAVGIVAEGPKLAYDERVGNIRVTQGQIEPGFKYIVVAPSTPAIRQLQRAPADVPGEVREFLDAPDPPPSVVSLLRRAPTDNAWDRIDFLRRHILLNVAASGPGTPVPVAPERVEEMLSRTKRGTPFEIVGAQALLARWGGVPSRIGYGFDRGDEGAGGTLEVRPRHGALFLEVYFEGFGWLPLVGDPLQAQEALSDQPQQFNPTVQTSEDVAVRLFLPVLREEEPRFFERVRTFLFRALPIVVGLALIYYLWPFPFKALRRARRRAWAAERGPAARVSLAYAEWRDYATDFGYRHYTDTPLMFVERATPDQEHEELAWLVTRTLWGDIRGNVTEEDALAAEGLSRSLRRRLAATQSPILRLVASLSRLSIRHPYAPELDAAARKLGREERELIHAS